jgi:2'-5' RNA ligase
MVIERPHSPRARLFVALDLPASVREGIDAWGGEALADPALRRVPVESLHITLAFLGHRPESEIERIAEIVAASVAPAIAIELLDPVPRPLKGRARLYALPARSVAAEALQAGLSEGLVDAGHYKPEKRAFWPHVTLARVRAEGSGSRRPRVVAEPPRNLPAALAEPCFCRRLTLYRSELQPSGAHYVPLAQVELSAEGQQ